MSRRLRPGFWSRTVLSLLLLAANVDAPFCASGLVRTPLGRLGRDHASRSAVRIRVVSPIGASHGFRAVVGVSGDPGEGGARASRLAFPACPLDPHHSPPARGQVRRLPAPPHPRLRC